MVTAQDRTRTLVVIRHSPYGSSLAKASVDVVLAAAAFDQAVELLLLGDGVLQLAPGQESALIGKKSIGRQLASLPLYDIESIYVDAAAVDRYKLDLTATDTKIRPLTAPEIHQLMLGFDHLLAF